MSVSDDGVPQFSDTPRSRKAMERCGIKPGELKMKAFQDFYIPSDPNPTKQRLRFTHYETRRQRKLESILSARAKVILEEKMQRNKPDATAQRSYQSLQMMEQLLDKEASRLEHDLKQQLKYHQAVEADNEEQLEKEKKLREKATVREERKQNATAALQTKVMQGKMNHTVRQENAKAGMKKMEKKKEEKVATHLADMLGTEVRLQQFHEEKAKQGSLRSDALEKKRAEIAEKFQVIEDKREVLGKELMDKREKQLQQMTDRQKEEAAKADLKHCDRNLRIMDTLDKKKQLERQQDFRLKKVQVDNKKSLIRVETMLQLKNEMISQRKKRLHAPKKCRAISMKNLPVGPGQYDVDREKVLHETPVTKISDANVAKGHIEFADQATKATEGIPPPGTYEPKLLRDGNMVEACLGTSVTFTKGTTANFAEMTANLTRANPGPGKYTAKVEVFHPTIGAKIRQPCVPRTADIPPAWAEVNEVSPGPATYDVDPFLRKEELRKSQKNLPNLSAAMQMAR